MDMSELFGDPISSYSRRQAIEDGMLVQLSGPGYEGDSWVPAMVAEAGFKYPIAMTASAFALTVAVPPDAQGQDIKGRLWDVLWMLKCAIASTRQRSDTLLYTFSCVTREGKRIVRLKCVCGPGDTPEPCFTLMLPEED